MKHNVKVALEARQKQIALAAEALAAEVNDWQTIQAYISRRARDTELTPIQEEKLKRYQFVYNQLVSGKYKEMEVVEQLEENWGVDWPQALRDLRDAKELFTTTLNVNKLFEIKAQLERNLVELQKASAQANGKTYAQLEKNRHKLLSMLPEDETSLADEFVARTNVLQYDPALLNVTPDNDDEVWVLVKDIKQKYGGKLTVNGKEVQDAEVVEW